jgi:hypothetical protein
MPLTSRCLGCQNASNNTREAFKHANKGNYKEACKYLVAAVNNLVIVVDDHEYQLENIRRRIN